MSKVNDKAWTVSVRVERPVPRMRVCGSYGSSDGSVTTYFKCEYNPDHKIRVERFASWFDRLSVLCPICAHEMGLRPGHSEAPATSWAAVVVDGGGNPVPAPKKESPAGKAGARSRNGGGGQTMAKAKKPTGKKPAAKPAKKK